MAKGKENLIGAWAFLIGVILAVVIGLFSAQLGASTAEWISILLVVLGLLIGLLNVGTKDAMTFLLSGAVLVIVSSMGSMALMVIPTVDAILVALLQLFVPATIIVALKAVFAIAKD